MRVRARRPARFGSSEALSLPLLHHSKPIAALRQAPINSVYSEAEEVFRRYGQQHRLSFCDAISVDSRVAIATITNGKNRMPAFSNVLSADQVRDVVAYVLEGLDSK